MRTIRTMRSVITLTTGSAIALTAFLSAPVPSAEAAQTRRPGSGWNTSQITLTGTVTRDLARDSFELRTDDGNTYEIRVGRYAEPRSLGRGDRVRVIGQRRGNIIIARDLEFLRDGNGSGDNNGQTTLTGVVTRDLARNQFELRADDGRTYRVRLARFEEPRSLDRGDRVRVTGQLRNKVFVAQNLELVRDTPANNNGQITITGTVIRDLARDNFEMRADNGRTYQVRVGRYDEPRSLDRGDRVRVTGQLRNGTLIARDLEFLRDTGTNNNGQITITGTVTRDLARDNFLLRTDNGRTYEVRVGRYAEPRSLERGDRVRVSGQLRDNVLVASNLEFLRDTRR